jgi:hypothetical protein
MTTGKVVLMRRALVSSNDPGRLSFGNPVGEPGIESGGSFFDCLVFSWY